MNRQQLNALFSYMVDWVIYQDVHGVYQFCNVAFANLLGCCCTEVMGKASLLACACASQAIVANQLEKLITKASNQATSEQCEYQLTLPDQRDRWFEVQTLPIASDTTQSADSQLEGILVIGHDITNRKRQESASQEQLALLQSIYNGAKTPIFAVDVESFEDIEGVKTAHFRFASFNQSAENIMGIERDALVGKAPNAEVSQRYQACYESERPMKYEECLQFGDKKDTWWLTKLSPLKNSAGDIYRLVGITTEITRRRQAESTLQKKAEELEATLMTLKQTQTHLIQTEKMFSLGQLVAGIAHEINNPISFIFGNIDHTQDYIQAMAETIALYQKKYPSPDDELKTYLDNLELDYVLEDLTLLLSSMKKGSERIQKIVLSLRDFSCLDESDAKEADINASIESTLVIVQSRLNQQSELSEKTPQITISKKLEQIPMLSCYPRQLNQVFLNILFNAIEALEGQFHPDQIASVMPTTPAIEIHTYQKNQTICIDISDNGLGIADDIKPQIFDPFFTTKLIGQGMGVGLAIAYQIVTQQHQGKLSCSSSTENNMNSTEKQTTFHIELPLQQQAT